MTSAAPSRSGYRRGAPRADQQTPGIGHNVAFTALDLLGRIIPTRPTTLGGLDELTVDDTRRRAGFTTGRLARLQQ